MTEVGGMDRVPLRVWCGLSLIPVSAPEKSISVGQLFAKFGVLAWSDNALGKCHFSRGSMTVCGGHSSLLGVGFCLGIYLARKPPLIGPTASISRSGSSVSKSIRFAEMGRTRGNKKGGVDIESDKVSVHASVRDHGILPLAA